VLNAIHVEVFRLIVAVSGFGIRGRLSTRTLITKESTMKVWSKPQVREQEVGLEVTSYLPAEIDII